MRKGIDKSNSCEGKIAFSSLDLASGAAAQINMKSGRSRVVSYKCKFCSSYHFGHENKRARTLKEFTGKLKLDPKEYSSNNPRLTEGYCIIRQIA